jgi:predicted alpha/beta-fold hydrolase
MNEGALLFGLSTYLLAAGFRFSYNNEPNNVTIIRASPLQEGNDMLQSILDDEKCKSVYRYYPSILAAIDIHGFLNTSFPVIIRSIYGWTTCQVQYKRELMKCIDGGTIAFDHASIRDHLERKNILDDAPIVVVHHGLCGDSQSEYIIHAVDKLLRRNFRVIVFIARGCGGLPLSTRKTFSASRVDDLEYALSKLRSDFPHASGYFGLSYSLGAGIMLNHLGKSQVQYLDGAVCVCPPWDFMEVPVVFTLFSPILAFSIKWYALSHNSFLQFGWYELLNIIFSVSLYQLDSCFLHMHGYNSVEEYYVDSSACYASQHIKVPTLAVSAEDDPICCHTGSPIDHIGPGLVIVKTRTGGHLGFSERAFSARSWTDSVAVEWFESILRNKTST